MEIVFHFGTSRAQYSMESTTSRIDGAGGKMNSFWAMNSLRMSFCSVPPSCDAGTPCFSSRALTFKVLSSIIGSGAQYLLRGTVRRPVLQQTLGEAWVGFQRLPGTGAGELGGHLRGLVAKPPLGELLRLAGGLQVLTVAKYRVPQLLHSLAAHRDGRHDGRLPGTLRGHVQH